MYRLSFFSTTYVLLMMLASVQVFGQVPGMISYQAKIVDDQTGPVNDTRTMVFSIYTQATGGSAIWTEQQNVTIVNGMVNVLLGSVSPLTSEIFQGSERYLGVKIGSDPEMTPRKRLLAVPYALRAEAATIRISPSGNISSTDVTSAISELDAEKLGLSGGTLIGRLNVYNERSNDVGLDAVSADSSAVQAINSGSGAPAMVAYNWGEGNGMYSFAESGNALWAINNSAQFVTIYAANNGDGNVIKVYNESKYPTIYTTNEGSGSCFYANNNGENATVDARNDGTGLGVYGYSKSSSGIQARTDSDEYAALYAINTGNGGGIYSEGRITTQTSDENSIVARNNSNTYPTIWGGNKGSSGVIYAKSEGNGVAIWAETANSNTVNISNNSDDYPTIWAKSNGKATALYGYSTGGSGGGFSTNSSSGYALWASSKDALKDNPGLLVWGRAYISGGVSSTMLTSAGTARAHTISSPQAEFSFSGSARLSSGEAQVSFAQTWQDCISLAEEYRVLITPTDMCNGICCVEKTPSGFRVKELMNGTSNASFDWMVRAVQKGSSTEKTLLAGAGNNVGMEIIDETEQEKQMLEVLARQQVLEEKMEEKKKEMEQHQGTSLSSTQEIPKRPQMASPASISPDKMEQRIKQVMEYKERLKEKAQRQ
ncbi:MAG TPA: hypothetical protein VM123_13135 [archaeon]|nr:hypothetical protein [archaeon]